MNILVTGMSGLIGNAVRRQLEGTCAMTALNRRPVDGVPCVQADIADFEAVLEAVTGMDVVVHMAADPSGGQWESVLRNNIVGAYNVFEACRQAGVKRIVAASTIQVSASGCHAPPR